MIPVPKSNRPNIFLERRETVIFGCTDLTGGDLLVVMIQEQLQLLLLQVLLQQVPIVEDLLVLFLHLFLFRILKEIFVSVKIHQYTKK